jgi:hypothetical protein
MDSSFPLSAYAPIPLHRPLSRFGKEFRVLISSGLAFNPDTVLRASTGVSCLLTAIRKNDKHSVLSDFKRGLEGRNRLSPTTRAKIRRESGPIGPVFDDALNGGPSHEEFAGLSDWEALARGWGELDPVSPIDVLIGFMRGIDQTAHKARDLAVAGERHKAEEMARDLIGNVFVEWRVLNPQLDPKAAVLLDTALRAIITLENTWRGKQVGQEPDSALVLSLLGTQHKPLGHWLAEVRNQMRVPNNRSLAELLARKKVTLHSRPITHDMLKKWASVQRGMLMSWKAKKQLLSVVGDAKQRKKLTTRFALARFLTFCCDFILSGNLCTNTQQPRIQ